MTAKELGCSMVKRALGYNGLMGAAVKPMSRVAENPALRFKYRGWTFKTPQNSRMASELLKYKGQALPANLQKVLQQQVVKHNNMFVQSQRAASAAATKPAVSEAPGLLDSVTQGMRDFKVSPWKFIGGTAAAGGVLGAMQGGNNANPNSVLPGAMAGGEVGTGLGAGLGGLAYLAFRRGLR